MTLRSSADAQSPPLTGHDLARELRELASRARRLPPPTARKPEAFHEGKSELARAIDRLAARVERETRARR